MLNTRSWVFLSSSAPSGSWKSKERDDLCPHPLAGASFLNKLTNYWGGWQRVKKAAEALLEQRVNYSPGGVILLSQVSMSRERNHRSPQTLHLFKTTLFLILETLGVSNETLKREPLNKKWIFTVSMRREAAAAADLSSGINDGSQPRHLFCINWCHTDVHDAAGGMLAPRPVIVVLYSMSCARPACCRWEWSWCALSVARVGACTLRVSSAGQ